MKTSEVKQHLDAKKRDVFGKKLKRFRKDGAVPANIYGPGFKSQAISIVWKDFNKTYRIAQETGIVYLKLEKQEVPVLIKNVQRHPVTSGILHVDFRKVDLSKNIETEVPLKIVGESPAVVQKGGVLLTHTDHIKLEALPENIPHEIEIDISNLTEVGSEIKVSDLKRSDKYTIKEDAEKLVLAITEHKEESLEPETAAAEPEVITEKAEGETLEGEAPEEAAEGEKKAAPAQEEKKEGKPQEKASEGKEPQKSSPDKAPEPKEEK